MDRAKGVDPIPLSSTKTLNMKQDRKIKVRMWVKAWGQEIEKIMEISSPPVSNMPCPSLQRKSDEALARLAVCHATESGFEIISDNDG